MSQLVVEISSYSGGIIFSIVVITEVIGQCESGLDKGDL